MNVVKEGVAAAIQAQCHLYIALNSAIKFYNRENAFHGVFLRRLRSMATHKDPSVRHLSVCPVVTLS